MFPVLAAAAVALSPVPAASQPQSAVERVEQALHELRPSVQVDGRAYEPRTIEDALRALHIPAASLAFIHEGQVVWARAFGTADARSGRAATPQTMFQAASISKPVAATGAAVMVEQGLLTLDRPVNEQLRSWRIPDHGFGESLVTLRHLLTHTAGLTVHGFPGYRPGSPLPTVSQILDGTAPANTAPVRVDIEPGSRWRYSGGGFTVAQLLMTDTAGEPFAALMDRLVLAPLGMTQSSYQQPLGSEALEMAAVAHDQRGEPIPGERHVYPELAAAGLWTTPSDLARWAAALSAAFNGTAVGPIEPEMARRILTPGMGNFGLGIGVTGEGEWVRFSHGGSNRGFRAMLIAFPRRGEGIVIMTNGENGGELVSALTQAVGRALGWPGSDPRMLVPAPVDRRALVARVGRYAADSFAVHVALADGDRLLFIPPEGASFEVVPQADDFYVSPANGFRLQFLTDPETGQVTGLSAGRVPLQRTH